ncbi:MAG: hypothetical protein AAGA66_02100 [Bacteroidota bacterium]
MKRNTSLFCLLLLSVKVLSQVSPVVVRNHPENTPDATSIEIKWITRQIVLPEGSNLYRRQVGETTWTKLNDQQIGLAKSLPTSFANEFPQAQDFFEMAPQIVDLDINDIGFLLINTYALLFNYTEFAEALGIYHRDGTAVPGVTYEYKAMRIKDGQEEEIGVSKPILAGAYQKEPPVAYFNIKQVKKQIELDWEVDDSRFLSYDIYYNIEDSVQNVKLNEQPVFPTLVKDSTGADVYPSPHFRFSKMKENRYYTFWIEGVDLFGANSRPSDSVTFLFNDTTPPEPATNLSGSVDSMKVSLNWTPSVSPDINEHVLYRSNQSDTLYQAIRRFKKETEYIDTVNIPGPYFYYVVAFDYAGNKRTSKVVYVNVGDIDPPAQPKGLVIRSDTGRLELSWRANTEPDLLGYQVFRTVGKDERSHYIPVNSEPLKETTLMQELPKVVRNKFFYYVVAIDTSFNRSSPSEFAVGQMPDILPPERPFIKKVTYDEEKIVIDWVENVEKDLMGYHLYRSDSTSTLAYERANQALISRDAFRFTDRRAKVNQGLLYYLQAVDSAGNVSAPSLTAYAYNKVVVENEYDQLSASVKYQKKKKTNLIQWQPLISENILGYVVFKATEGQKLKPITGLLKTTNIKDPADEGKTSTYQVKAFTQKGDKIPSKKLVIKNKAAKK